MALLPIPVKYREVMPVPEISIEFPRIELGETQVAAVDESPWRNTVREFVLGIVVTTTVHHYEGRWSSMDYDLFRNVVMNGPWTFFRAQVAHALMEMATEELLDIVEVEGKMYVVPTQTLAQVLQQSQVVAL